MLADTCTNKYERKLPVRYTQQQDTNCQVLHTLKYQTLVVISLVIKSSWEYVCSMHVCTYISKHHHYCLATQDALQCRRLLQYQLTLSYINTWSGEVCHNSHKSLSSGCLRVEGMCVPTGQQLVVAVTTVKPAAGARLEGTCGNVYNCVRAKIG